MTTWEALGITVNGHVSGQHSVQCPRCSASRTKARTPCLSINLDEGLYNCHHCGWSGGLKQGEQTSASLSSLPKIYRKPAYPRPPPPALSLEEWFRKRGIPRSVLERRHISTTTIYMPQLEAETKAIQFPYYRRGECVNIKYRDAHKNFRMVSGAERILYGLDDIEGDCVCICEGECDAMAIEVAGYSSVVSVPDGAPAPATKNYASKFDFLETCEADLAPLREILIAVDNDLPGNTLAAELARRLGPERCLWASWPDGCKDANDVLVRHGASILRQCLDQAKPWPISGIGTGKTLKTGVEAMYDSAPPRGLSTGWFDLDQYYTVRPGELSIISGIPSHGKALSLDTLVPTPTGWTTMGQIVVGDRIFDETGNPTTVVAVTETMYGHPCYEVHFSDGTNVIADEQHEWLTNTDKARRSARLAKRNVRLRAGSPRPHGTDQTRKHTYPSVVTTKEITETLVMRERFNHAVPVARPLVLPEASVPIPPYTLGVWLGDGSVGTGEFSKPDQEIAEFIREDGYVVTQRSDPDAHGILGLLVQLRAAGLYRNKHIPAVYLRASTDQRLRLLQGLLDTDGHITSYGRVEFCSTTCALAEGVFELAASLGFRPVMLEDRARLNGEDYGPRYRITWTPNRPVFRLPRKRQYCKDTAPKSQHRYIVAVKPVPSVPVKCIQVDSPSHLYLITQAFIPTHNSAFMSALTINMAKCHDWNFTIFSPENAPMERYAATLISLYNGKRFWGESRMSREEMHEGLAWLDAHVTFLMPEDESPTIDWLLQLAKIQVYRQGIKGLVLDPWNEIDFHRPTNRSETEHISTSLSQIKRFAMLHGVHVWVIAHPTKLRKADTGKYAGQYPPPTPYDISGSAHFRNKADNCITIWRDVDVNDNRVSVFVQKVRFLSVGKPGEITLTYQPASGRFTEPHLEDAAWTP
mgnify:CR=1 FL=1